jgi:putative flavoprotein involved in K+ transport
MTPATERLETVIVGAGQAGLSVGHHLAERNRPFLIVDSNGRVGDNWRRHWDSLRLYSRACLDGLPGVPFPAPRLELPDEGRDRGLLRYRTIRKLAVLAWPLCPARRGTALMR